MYGSFHVVENEAKYRRREAERYAEQWRLAKLARPSSRPGLQVWARLVDLAGAAARSAIDWLALPSEPREQCC
jgi:hypothetical protein